MSSQDNIGYSSFVMWKKYNKGDVIENLCAWGGRLDWEASESLPGERIALWGLKDEKETAAQRHEKV